MKKITVIILSALLMLTLCFGCSSPADDIYIGEGKMTVIRSLISTNGFLANEVFGTGHLPIDATQTVKQGAETYALVVSDRISSYAELENLVRSTYIEEVAAKLLSEPRKYVDIDGKLYLDLHYDTSGDAEYDWSEFEINFKKLNDDGSYLFKVKAKKTNGFNSTVKMSVSDTDGTLRLCDFYN